MDSIDAFATSNEIILIWQA